MNSLTESTLLDLVTPDGCHGFMVRIARHVDEGIAWVWLVTYGPDGVHGFVDDRISLLGDRTPDDSIGAKYEVALPPDLGVEAFLSRQGSALTPSGGFCVVDVLGHHGSDVPRGRGNERMRIEASFAVPDRPAGSNLQGRTESIVSVEATLSINGVTRQMHGMGQFHEQIQETPRFDTPFTYMSLRGPVASLIGLRGPRAGGGILISEGAIESFQGLDLDAHDTTNLWKRRDFRGGSEPGGGRLVTGYVEPTVVYSLPIGNGRRPSSIVRGEMNGREVSGFVNDWSPSSA